MLAYIFSALIIALALSLFLSYGFKNRLPRRYVGGAFILIFLGVWASSLWIRPVGPALYGVSWIPMFFVGTFLALLLASFVPPASRLKDKDTVDKEFQNRVVATGVFFWIIMLILILAIALGYYL